MPRAYDLGQLNELLAACNGVTTYPFSQTEALQRVGETRIDGVCLAMACHWIQSHAFDDSIVNHIGGVDDRHGQTILPFNHTAFRYLVNWQRNITTFPNWKMACGAWLRNHGLKIRSQRDVETSRESVRNELQTLYGAYAMVTLKSTEQPYSHAVAVYIGQTDACFFDANYGEFWFERKRDFHDFFHFFANFHYRRNHHHHLGLDAYHFLGLER